MCPAAGWGPRVLPRDRLLLRSVPHHPSLLSPGAFPFLQLPISRSRFNFIKGTSMSTSVSPHRRWIQDGSANYTFAPGLSFDSSSRSTLDPLAGGTSIDGTSSGNMGISAEFPAPRRAPTGSRQDWNGVGGCKEQLVIKRGFQTPGPESRWEGRPVDHLAQRHRHSSS